MLARILFSQRGFAADSNYASEGLMFRLKWPTTLLVALMLMTIASPRAAADPYGTAHPIPGTFTPTYCVESSLPALLHREVTAAAQYASSVTQYKFSRSCHYPRVMVKQTSSEQNARRVRGYNKCRLFTIYHECHSTDMRLSPVLLRDSINARKTSCHELGHFLGLIHHERGYGCMVKGAVKKRTSHYVQHHLRHIAVRKKVKS